MENTIILLIDVFNPDKTLLKYGVYTAKNLGAKILLFDTHFESVVPPNDVTTSGTTAVQVIKKEQEAKEAKQRLETIYKKISEDWYHTKAKMVTDPIPVWNSDKEWYLLDEVSEVNPSLVLMKITSDFNLINELFGTPETKVAKEANCPVLLIPQGVDYNEIKDIHYLLEREKPIEEILKEIQFLKQMADNFVDKSTINLIYYFGDNKEQADKELALKKSILLNEMNYDKLVFINMADHEIGKAIHQNIKKYAADIFAFPKRGKSFLDRLVSKDNTKRLILKAKIPVLVF